MTTRFSCPLRAYDFSHLSVGDIVEARKGQTVHHHGLVDEALPTLGLFWIQDIITGQRRIVDFESFDVWYASASLNNYLQNTSGTDEKS